jgi:NAD kinase
VRVTPHYILVNDEIVETHSSFGDAAEAAESYVDGDRVVTVAADGVVVLRLP